MIFWIIWQTVGTLFIILFTIAVIPKVMLKSYAATLPVRVKALERFSDDYGDVAVYATSPSVRKYIKSYRIARNANGTYFRGEWSKAVAVAEYELAVYGADDRIMDVIRVKEKFNCGKSTHDTYLPQGVDYVTLRVLCVDGDPLPAERRKFNFSYACWLALLCICIVFAADIFLWLTTTFVLRWLDGFTMKFNLTVAEWAALLGFPALAITVTTCTISLCKFFFRKKEGASDE